MVEQEPGANQHMKRFASIEKIDTGILYALELTASISVLLLAFGLIASKDRRISIEDAQMRHGRKSRVRDIKEGEKRFHCSRFSPEIW
jgi:hypothetical protein